MKSNLLLGLVFAIVGTAAVLAQGQGQVPAPRQGPALQAAQHPGYGALIAKCKNPPPSPAAAAGGPGGGVGRAGGAPATPPAPADYTVTAIPGVIAAGQRWKLVWESRGNNADGIVGTADGGLLVGQNDNSVVMKLDKDGKPSTAYSDINTAGALSMSSTGALFVGERGLNSAILQLAPKRQVLASKYEGDPLDCIGGLLNDITADGKGGVYVTINGLIYADSKGVVTKYGDNLRTNGLVLSPDEKILYVTDGPGVAAFDVQPDGSLKNQRAFAKLPFGNADGCTVDAAGRLYVTGGAAVHVIAPDGKYLGNIPAPGGLTSVAFSGPERKTLYIVYAVRYGGMRDAQIYAIDTIAQGYKGRAK